MTFSLWRLAPDCWRMGFGNHGTFYEEVAVGCPHPFKAIRGYNEESRAIEWVCSTCKAPGSTDWEKAHHWERAEALMKYYEKESPEMMGRG